MAFKNYYNNRQGLTKLPVSTIAGYVKASVVAAQDKLYFSKNYIKSNFGVDVQELESAYLLAEPCKALLEAELPDCKLMLKLFMTRLEECRDMLEGFRNQFSEKQESYKKLHNAYDDIAFEIGRINRNKRNLVFDKPRTLPILKPIVKDETGEIKATDKEVAQPNQVSDPVNVVPEAERTHELQGVDLSPDKVNITYRVQVSGQRMRDQKAGRKYALSLSDWIKLPYIPKKRS